MQSKKIAVLILSLVIMLGSLTSGAMASSGRHHHSKIKGALVGGAAGALIGGKKGAVIGAGTGALVQHARNKRERRVR